MAYDSETLQLAIKEFVKTYKKRYGYGKVCEFSGAPLKTHQNHFHCTDRACWLDRCDAVPLWRYKILRDIL